jgi:hypothetical protein
MTPHSEKGLRSAAAKDHSQDTAFWEIEPRTIMKSILSGVLTREDMRETPE